MLRPKDELLGSNSPWILFHRYLVGTRWQTERFERKLEELEGEKVTMNDFKRPDQLVKVKVLRDGGQAVVFSARLGSEVGERVAVKVLKPEPHTEPVRE